jgi:hypothetical protein
MPHRQQGPYPTYSSNYRSRYTRGDSQSAAIDLRIKTKTPPAMTNEHQRTKLGCTRIMSPAIERAISIDGAVACG